MNSSDLQRKPHASLDPHSRNVKAKKIERLLNLDARNSTIKILEIGTGSGFIAHYFANHPFLECSVDSVDVNDQRQIDDGFRFHLVNDTSLPFPDEAFDVVITNHVIEHVGDVNIQGHHLREVRRVMHPDGIGYLAAPNRWMFIEPHYRLAFLSWLPPAWRTPYLRAMKRGEVYDCTPPSLHTLESLMTDSQLAYKNLFAQALRVTINIEGSKGLLATAAAILPDALLSRFAPINPTLIYKLTRS